MHINIHSPKTNQCTNWEMALDSVIKVNILKIFGGHKAKLQ